MASLKTRALLEQLEDVAVASALRAAGDFLVDAAIETIAAHVVALERRNRELEELVSRIDAALEKGEGS